ncbi:OmpA family protein [Maribacter chungangensis]|uniref:OmpA family protein n=1 Tax=Maribacter chungangensis TaxID=1069117 RepID=A0ABW3AZ13_9FLAO
MTFIQKITATITIYTLLLTCSSIVGQEKKVQKVTDNFNKYAYAEAIESYESLLEQGFTDLEIFKNLGNANYFNANYQDAAKWYGKLFDLENPEVASEYLYRYAQSLKSIENYAESDKWMKKLELAKEKDNRLSKYINNDDYLKTIKENSGRYKIKNLDINSSSSDFAPSLNGKQLIFSTARDSGLFAKRIHNWNNKSFLNLYSADISENGELSNPKQLSGLLNKKTHESSTAFTKDGNTMYFTRNNSKNGKFSRDDEGVSRLKIYRSKLKNGEWSNIEELPFNGENYSVAHPALNADESKLYFASDMEGTLGASDIFVVEINTDGSFGPPKNLGPGINTESRETFPFVTEANILYFASDGHPGLGGLDIFAANLEDSEISTVINLGSPINTPEDDFSFIFNETSKTGYFASNRKEGKGDDDIYSFKETKDLNFEFESTLDGVVKNLENGAILPNATVEIKNIEGSIIATAKTDETGYFNIPFKSTTKELSTVITLAEYEVGGRSFTPNKNGITLEFLLAPKANKVGLGEDVAKYLNMPMIYFDFDKSNIRPDAALELDKIVAFMNEYPEVNIEIGSHTDSRGNDYYNLSLSEKRAQATRSYLIDMGIDSSRLSAKGYGETQLTNNCGNSAENSIECGKAQHELNRRSEFIIVK